MTAMEPLLVTLDRLRDTVLAKVSGLDHQQLGQRLEPSSMTLGGLLSHLTNVEDWWVNQGIARQPAGAIWREAPWSQDRDWDWHRARDISPERLLTEYREAIALSREQLGTTPDLEAVVVVEVGRGSHEYSVGWVLMHLIEEYARHCGHADLLREAIDGSTG